MNHHQKSPLRRGSNGNKSRFTRRVKRIINRNREAIAKNRSGFLEADTMPSQVSFGFFWVPLEVHKQGVQYLYCFGYEQSTVSNFLMPWKYLHIEIFFTAQRWVLLPSASFQGHLSVPIQHLNLGTNRCPCCRRAVQWLFSGFLPISLKNWLHMPQGEQNRGGEGP